MMRQRRMATGFFAVALLLGASGPAVAGFPKSPLTKCAPDAVVSSTVCMDKYEASVWRVTDPTGLNKGLVAKIQKGTATLANLTAGGATQLGVAGDDYAPCTDNGQNCANDIYAVSLPSVTPSADLTWFQALAACKNARKRLPSNAEWQAGVAGTPDPGGDNGTNDCNSNSTLAVTATGSRTACVSSDGAFDMVGNLYEWVADWVPASTACPNWGGFSDDDMCLSGASTTATGPGALLRGGFFAFGGGTLDGPLAVLGTDEPSASYFAFGFRCAR